MVPQARWMVYFKEHPKKKKKTWMIYDDLRVPPF